MEAHQLDTRLTWEDFLTKIRTLKKDYETGQIDLKAPALVTLLYAGAFDGMIGRPDLDHSDYRRHTDELLAALGSKAQLPKAKKGDLIGISDIKSNLDLHLWRSESNPTYRYDFTTLFDTFLTAKQFVKYGDNHDIAYRRAVEGKPEILVFRSIKTLFKNPAYANLLRKDSKILVGVVGIVKDFSVRKTKKGTEMGTFRIFLGDGLSDPIYIWPDWAKDPETGNRFSEVHLPYRKIQDIRNGRAGIALVKPSFWNSSPQCTLVAWACTNDRIGE